MDELLQGSALGEQLGQPRLQHHVGQDGQQVVCPAVTTGTCQPWWPQGLVPQHRTGHRSPQPRTCPSLPILLCLAEGRSSRTHMAAVVRLWASRVPQYSSAHSQMPRRARTVAQGSRQGHCHPRTPAPRPHCRSPMHSSFLRGHVSSGMRRRSCTAEAYAGRPGVGGKRREASPMSAGLACRCRSMLRARAASRGCCTVLRAQT